MKLPFKIEPIKLDIPDADITYIPNFFNSEIADSIFADLIGTVPWQQDIIKIYGKAYSQPRLTALFGDTGKSYSYSNIRMQPHQWTLLLQKIKAHTEIIAETYFTTVLLNYYRDGNDSNGWHADDEKELGKNPIIASLSFGATRLFQLKHNTDKSNKKSLPLEHGSLLLMKGTTQHFWKHQIPKTSEALGPRVNLTFRALK